MTETMHFFISSLIALSLVNCLEGAVTKAYADIHPTEGHHVSGRVVFVQEANGIRVVARLIGLSPGPHGFHIHEKGDCSAKDASSAGAHFNPDNQPHASPDAPHRHVGDLGNIVADQNGVAEYDTINDLLQLEGVKTIIGKAVIVHEKSDDFKTQPTGNAGGRLGCGVIKIMQSE